MLAAWRSLAALSEAARAEANTSWLVATSDAEGCLLWVRALAVTEESTAVAAVPLLGVYAVAGVLLWFAAQR